jgi:hypothetical protein
MHHAQGGVGFGAVILRHDRVLREREQACDEGKGDEDERHHADGAP